MAENPPHTESRVTQEFSTGLFSVIDWGLHLPACKDHNHKLRSPHIDVSFRLLFFFNPSAQQWRMCETSGTMFSVFSSPAFLAFFPGTL